MSAALHKYRLQYDPKLPGVLGKIVDKAVITEIENGSLYHDIDPRIAEMFKHTYGKPVVGIVKGQPQQKELVVGVVLSGGQAPGGHNVIIGLHEALKKCGDGNRLIGFLGGPSGLLENKYMVVNDKIVKDYKNTGGFDMIGSGRTKLKTAQEFAIVANTCKHHGINALVVIGGDDSNTNAAVLAEYFASNGIAIQVVGVPKTIDGDLKHGGIEISFGFDTACKTYAELIGNIARDANSAKKYWHFIRLMGRSASHIALECALLTQPNVCLIGEEIKEKKISLKQVASTIVDSIVARANQGNNFGIVLVPEGLIEFIPEIGVLISEINELLSHNALEISKLDKEELLKWVGEHLLDTTKPVFASLPQAIALQMLAERDPHGNVQVSAIKTEELLMTVVQQQLDNLATKGEYKGKFNAIGHFFGYEGRAAYPTNFDADYCFALGHTAYVLIANGLTGYIASIKNSHLSVDQWQPQGVPLTSLMAVERRHGQDNPVIKKALVDLNGNPFKKLVANREQWAINTDYINPGPIQYFGPVEVSDIAPMTLVLEQS
ncbi:MAG: diphosphate--fructose-6-phosphate 1-phosphotransferase [Firmicutes bacterium]|nr:diphosphate--fructose-6-phosphate 1-phosphotransferase [Bacillota bacterium]MCL1953976.1 diphosphate--fructose-6-phosphate 1-phosphotransferase [Bacillota bacterium]